MDRGSLKALMLIALIFAGEAVGDVVETRDGKKLEGTTALVNGQLIVTPGEPPVVRLKLDQIARFEQSNPAPATGEVVEGLMGEYFADNKLEKPCAVALVHSGSFFWGHQSPNPYTPANWSVRMTGYVNIPQRGQYVFRADAFSRVVIGGRELGKDKAADDRGFAFDTNQRVPVLLEFKTTPGQHARANLYWSSESIPYQPVPGRAFSPADDFSAKLEAFHLKRMTETFGGLKGEYFSDAEMKKRVFVRLDAGISMSWQKAETLDTALKERVAIRWTGRVKSPKTIEAKFSVSGDARMWIGGKQIIDAWPVEGQKPSKSGTFPVKEGEFYDLKIEMLAGSGSAQMKLTSNLESNGMSSLSSKLLYPPKDVPRAHIVLPTPESEIAAADGAMIRVVATPGEGSVRKVEIVTNDGKEVLAETNKRPFDLLIRPETESETTLRARVTNSLGYVSLSEPLTITINTASGEAMGGDWSLGRVGDTPPPVLAEDGSRVSISGRSGRFGEQSALPLVSRALKGDGEIIARIVELKTDQPETFALAGLTLRRGMRTDSPHVTLMASKTSGWFVTKAFRETDTSTYVEKPVTLPVWIRLTRSGPIATVSSSEDGKLWNVVGSQSLGDDRPIVAGLTAFSLNADQPVTAVFDNIAVHESESAPLATGPGVQTISGSVLQGQLTVGDNEISVRGADGKVRTVRRSEVARVFYGPIHSSTIADLPAGWQGAIIRGDKLEGTVSDLSADGATISSMLFGPQPSMRTTGLAAVLLADVTVDPRAPVVRHTGGRVVGGDPRIDADHLVITTGPWSDLRLPLAEILSIRAAR